MRLKKQIERDIDHVFFDLEEFGEIHQLEDTELVCVVDEDSLGSTSVTESRDLQASGLTSETFTVYLAARDYPRKEDFKKGRYIRLDEKEMSIEKVTCSMGILCLVLKQIRGY